jgi:hypothetical protein
MLLDGSIKEHNVDGHVCVCVYVYIYKPGCLPQSASFKVMELDFLTYLLVVAEP